GELLGTVVGGIHDDGVVLKTEFLELVEQQADVAVMLDHPVGIDAEAGLALAFRLQAGPDVHAGRVPPQEERLVGLFCVRHEAQGLSVNSSSTVSMRFLSSAPVSSILWVPSGFAQAWITPRVAYLLIISGSLK